MNLPTPLVSRRTFLLTGSAAVASALTPHPAALSVAVVGFGEHAQRFIPALSPDLLEINSVLDSNPSALTTAQALLGRRQRNAPIFVESLANLNRVSPRSPVLLCAPPESWPNIVPALISSGRPILVYHSGAFSADQSPLASRMLHRFRTSIKLVGFDPAFPLCAFAQFHSFARARGAQQAHVNLVHSGWSEALVSAFHFDCLNAFAPIHEFPSIELKNNFFTSLRGFAISQTSEEPTADCSSIAQGRNIQLVGKITVSATSTGHSPDFDQLHEFSRFCLASPSVRVMHGERQSAILRHLSSDHCRIIELS